MLYHPHEQESSRKWHGARLNAAGATTTGITTVIKEAGAFTAGCASFANTFASLVSPRPGFEMGVGDSSHPAAKPAVYPTTLSQIAPTPRQGVLRDQAGLDQRLQTTSFSVRRTIKIGLQPPSLKPRDRTGVIPRTDDG